MAKKRSKLILIGAPKSGTTSLAHWLGRHPQAKIGWAKEPCFFTDYRSMEFSGPGAALFPNKPVFEADAYEAMFDCEKNATWGIDGSTDYFARPESPQMIAEYAKNVDVKLLVILRDPIKRAFSQYAHNRSRRFEDKSFIQSLELEEERKAANWTPLFYHIERSRYGTNLQRYMELFSEDRFKIMPFEALRDEAAALREVEEYLELPAFDYGDLTVRNSSTAERSRTLDYLIRKDNPLKKIAKAVLPKSVREKINAANEVKLKPTEQELRAAYDLLKNEIDLATELVPFDTSHWTRF